ncbi:hypothetical protein ACFQNE_14065 [Gordonia phosphorivorans]|uniref:Transposase n=1 Tax=Gordonia phosphorivorans TaxID=1056982 RepID=A0ABV6H8F1_9ACTN
MSYSTTWAEANYAARNATAVNAADGNEALHPDEPLTDDQHAVIIDADGGSGLVLYGTRQDLLDAIDEIRRKILAAPENRKDQR